MRTPLGWTLMGPMGGIYCRQRDLNINFVCLVESARKDEDSLMKQVERFWAIEARQVTLTCACRWKTRKSLQSWNDR